MYLAIMKELESEPQYSRPDRVVAKNALVEALMLHTRNVVDIILSRGVKDDDIQLKHIAPGFNSSLIDKLRKAYGDNKTKDDPDPCWIINKRIAHPTTKRLKYITDYIDLIEKINPLLLAIFKELE